MRFLGKNLRAAVVAAVFVRLSVVSGEDAGVDRTARYTPHAEWPFEPGRFAAPAEQPPRYWRGAETIRAERSGDAPPLAGLRLALDPGHIGGEWADDEAREFRMAEGDFWVREGELVLWVAREVRDRLEALGAKVWLVRDAPEPLNPRRPVDYIAEVAGEASPAANGGMADMADYALALRDRAVREAIVVDELRARIRRVNRDIRPDALLSLHINAAPWPEPRRLVSANHSHVLIYGCLSEAELASAEQRERLAAKLANGSGAEERLLGARLGGALAETLALPPSEYSGDNAVRLEGVNRYVWARNLMMLRGVDCPAVMLEPFVANSESAYPRLQATLAARHSGRPPPDDCPLAAYAAAVVEGVRRHFGRLEGH